MRAALLIVGTLSLLRAQPSAPQASTSLVGRWRSVETSKGGIGAVYRFRDDGTFDFSPGAIVDMPYRMEGDQVIFPPATTTGPEMRTALAWPSNDVVRMTMEGHAEEYKRQGAADPRDRLFGEWLGSRDMDGKRMPVQMFFYSAGRSLLVILFTTRPGRYSVTNDRLVAQIGGQAALDGTFEITGGVLSIFRSGGRITKLARY